VNHVGHFLYRYRDRFLCPDLGLYQSGGTAVGGSMEYAIAGITAVLLFIYLMYALLRPERF
jgi:K+-transporting ATPase KdpF subunit